MGEEASPANQRVMVETSPNVAHRHHLMQTSFDYEDAEAEPSKYLSATAPHERDPLLAGDHRFSNGGGADVTTSTATTTTTTNNLSITDDARDEEEEDSLDAARSIDETFSYSDESESLSDAYFFPQSDEEFLARPARYRNDVDPAQVALQQYPLASYYGSVSSNHSSSVNNAAAPSDRSSPLWAASIQEDSEEKVSLPNHQPMLLAVTNDADRIKGRRERRRERRRQREEHIQQVMQHHQQHKQQSLSTRERAVVAVRGRPQNPQHAQDFIWALLFLVQLVAVIVCAIRFGYMLWFAQIPRHFWQMMPWSMAEAATSIMYNASIQELEYNDDDLDSSYLSNTAAAVVPAHFEFTIDYQNVVALLSVTGFYSCILTYLSFGFMLVLARSLIQIMLVFSVVLALAWGMIGLTLDPYGIISIMGFTALLLTLGYSLYNWGHIPFAAQNLYTAMCALRCTADITILGLGCLLVAFAWCIVWGMAFIGIVNSLNNVECERKDACGPHVENRHIPLYAFLLFSFLWTNSVIKNITRVTVANVVGTWWFSPGSVGRICTPVLGGALLRAVTTSLGSICLGSLVVQPAQALVGILKCCCCVVGNPESNCMNPQGSRVVPQARKRNALLNSSEDTGIGSPADSIGLCRRICGLNDHVSVCLRSCNRWSFTYIGMCKYLLCDQVTCHTLTRQLAQPILSIANM